MVRVARAADGTVTVGRTAPGRGAWLCRDDATGCLERAGARRALARALRTELSDEDVAEIGVRLYGPRRSAGER
jgi:predicted RNA-binding protein YlxR (DUF448 family)